MPHQRTPVGTARTATSINLLLLMLLLLLLLLGGSYPCHCCYHSGWKYRQRSEADVGQGVLRHRRGKSGGSYPTQELWPLLLLLLLLPLPLQSSLLLP